MKLELIEAENGVIFTVDGKNYVIPYHDFKGVEHILTRFVGKYHDYDVILRPTKDL